ncbi:hypothetical protein BBJ28_00023768 [Nothophytophthora sp. Chile5]|nr:hypothetical protein BBJ28_00023768 [Nothophytophthora sp. Chile5]
MRSRCLPWPEVGKLGTWGRSRALLAVLLFVLVVRPFVWPRASVSELFKTATPRLPPPTSVLHPNAPRQAPLSADVAFSIETTATPFAESTESFPQYGKSEPGQHYRIENSRLIEEAGRSGGDSLLLMTVFNDEESWGANRSVADFFQLVGSFDYPKAKTSIAMLTSSMDEFTKVKAFYGQFIHDYAQLSVIFRNDFSQEGLTRANRHADSVQANRRRMLSRYRNYALLSTLQTWQQHVVWLDADINVVPSGLVRKMTQSGRDIVEPMCVRMHHADSNKTDDWYDYDLNAWVGQRKVRPAALRDGEFVPGPLKVKHMWDLRSKKDTFTPLDSVGGTMLYVRADVHRQGVLFPAHYLIGGKWTSEGYDGIETEGLCYTAHFLGFKCWAMPHDLIYHAT